MLKFHFYNFPAFDLFNKTNAHFLNASSSSTVAHPAPAHLIFAFESTRKTYPTCLFSIPIGARRYSRD